MLARVYSWEESVGDALEMSRREIYRALRLHNFIIKPFPDLAEALSRHPIVGENAKQLRDIADIRDEALRRQAIELLLDDPELSADEARVRVGIDAAGGPDRTPVQKIVNAAFGNLGRLSAPLQKRHLDGLIAALKSDEVKRQLRDRLNEELGDG